MTHLHTYDNARFFLGKLQYNIILSADDYDQKKYFIYKNISLLFYAKIVTRFSFLFPFLFLRAVDDIEVCLLASLAKGEGGTSVLQPLPLFLQLTEVLPLYVFSWTFCITMQVNISPLSLSVPYCARASLGFKS